MITYKSPGGAVITIDCELEPAPGLAHFLTAQIDAALVARVDSLTAELDALRIKTATIAQTAQAIAADATKTAAQKVAAINALASDALKTKKERDLAAAIKSRDEAQTVVDELSK